MKHIASYCFSQLQGYFLIFENALNKFFGDISREVFSIRNFLAISMACGLRWGDDNLIVLSEIPIATRFCDKHVVRIGLLTECHDQVAFVYHSVKLLLFL